MVVSPRHSFAIEGESEGTLRVAGRGETLSLRFALRATDLGAGEVRVHAFHRTQLLGTITLHPLVVEEAIGPAAVGEQPLAPATVRSPVADLDMMITDQSGASGPEYVIRLVARDPSLSLVHAKFGPVSLKMDARAYFRDVFNDVTTCPAKRWRAGER